MTFLGRGARGRGRGRGGGFFSIYCFLIYATRGCVSILE